VSVRAKFQLVSETANAGTKAKSLVFQPRYDTSIPEDQRFATATPSGELKMYVDNPAALAQFELGQQYYIDFTPVPKPETA
jgi:hypothetical protein